MFLWASSQEGEGGPAKPPPPAWLVLGEGALWRPSVPSQLPPNKLKKTNVGHSMLWRAIRLPSPAVQEFHLRSTHF